MCPCYSQSPRTKPPGSSFEPSAFGANSLANVREYELWLNACPIQMESWVQHGFPMELDWNWGHYYGVYQERILGKALNLHKRRKAWVAVSPCRSHADLGQLGNKHGANL